MVGGPQRNQQKHEPLGRTWNSSSDGHPSASIHPGICLRGSFTPRLHPCQGVGRPEPRGRRRVCLGNFRLDSFNPRDYNPAVVFRCSLKFGGPSRVARASGDRKREAGVGGNPESGAGPATVTGDCLSLSATVAEMASRKQFK